MRPHLVPSLLILAMLFLAGPAPAEAPDAGVATPDGMRLVFEEDFANGSDRWEMTDASAWAVEEADGKPVLALKGASDYEPPVRSPKNIAWLKDVEVGDFVLEVRMRYTGRAYNHADLCLFFGRQDPARFYYVHLATAADPHANSIFLVNNEPRVSIAKERTDGTAWSDGWHTVRIKRTLENGRIEVYFDDLETPAMIAEDRTHGAGRIGLGSFDDTGQFGAVRVWTR